jgi:bacterioferritin (cytochrome b1)
MKPIEELIKEQEQPQTLDASESIIEPVVTSEETTTEESAESQEVINYSSEEVISLLKQSLNVHWQQTTSLSAQAVHLDRWGYKKLAAIIKKDAEEEHEHAMINLKRLEFFDVDYQPLIVSPQSWARHDMVAMIEYNLQSVREAASVEKATIVAARAMGDELTANSMIPLLQGSENGIEIYESYLKQISQMGLDNFLSLYA